MPRGRLARFELKVVAGWLAALFCGDSDGATDDRVVVKLSSMRANSLSSRTAATPPGSIVREAKAK